MKWLPRINPEERRRFFLLAFLFMINSLILEANEVVATTGFIINVGVESIVIVWGIVYLIVLLTSSAYSLFVDRLDRRQFGVLLFLIFAILYIIFYVLFMVGAPDFLTYGLLSVFNEQQWILFPMLIWALANDVFSIAEAKRIFPLLAAPTIIGGILGNGLAALIAPLFEGQSYQLLLFNAILILTGAFVLVLEMSKLDFTIQQADQQDKIKDIIEEGIGFIKDVPVFRYLTIIMLLMGIALNTIEYQFLQDVSANYDAVALQSFYGIFKIAQSAVTLLLQMGLVTWLLQSVGFKKIFGTMPGVMLIAVALAIFWISPIGVTVILTGAIAGDFLVRSTISGVDEPARRAFQGLVPDVRRGRVSAFMDGFLYPIGSILGCLVIGIVILLEQRGVMTLETGRIIYLGIAAACAIVAIWATTQFSKHYDSSMLNWRLKRRSRGKSVLSDIEF